MQSTSKKSMFIVLLMFFLMFATGLTGCSSANSRDEDETRTEHRKDRDDDENEDNNEDNDEEEDEDSQKKDRETNKDKDKSDEYEEDDNDREDWGDEEPVVDTQNQEVQEITWFFWDDLDYSNDLITQGYRDVIQRFNEKYKGKYRVKAVTTNIYEYFIKLRSMVYEENLPDVFISDPGIRLTELVELGATLDLTDILRDNPEWYDSFYGGMFDTLTYDGKIMAIPANFASVNIFYNKEIFKEVGVAIPTTFDEWISVCKKIQSAGYTPISCAAGTPWCLGMYAGYFCDRVGGTDSFNGVMTGTLDWTAPAYVNAAEKLLELSKYFQSTAELDNNDIATMAFCNGQAAMLVQGSWTIGAIKAANPDTESDYGVFSFPAIEDGTNPNRMMLKSDIFCISKNTKNLEACVALLKMFTDETTQKYVVETGGKFPSSKVKFDKTKVTGMTSEIMALLEKTKGTFGFYNESLPTSEAGNIFDNAFVDIVCNPRCSVQQGLEKIQKYFKDNIW